MSSSIVLANELYIVYDGTQIACTTDFNLNIEKASIDIKCGDSWASNLAGAKSWSLEFTAVVKRNDPNGYLKYNDLMMELVISDIPVGVALKSEVLTDNYYQGQAVLTNLTQTGSTDEVATYSGTLLGYGQLSILTNNDEVFPFVFPFNLT